MGIEPLFHVALMQVVKNPSLSDLVGGIQSVTLGELSNNRNGSNAVTPMMEVCVQPPNCDLHAQASGIYAP